MFLRVVVNDQEVCRTSPCNLSEDFSVVVARRISIVVEYLPDGIVLEIYEQHGFVNRKISQTFLAIPDEKITVTNAPTEAVEFGSADRIEPNNAGVGSGNY